MNVPVVGLYISAVFNNGRSLPCSPPVISTVPSGSKVDVWNARGEFMLPVAVKVPLDGSYNTAELSHAVSFWPPVINTLPEGSSVCAAAARLGESGMVASACPKPAPKEAIKVNSKDTRNDFFMVNSGFGRRKPSKDEDPRLADKTAKSKFF